MLNSNDFSTSVNTRNNTTSIVSAPVTQSRLLFRYYLQSLSRELIPKERVEWCLRRIKPTATSVTISISKSKRSAHYKNLMICGSLWHCPVCAAHISEHRRHELATALQSSLYTPVLITYTLSHNIAMKLPPMLSAILTAFRKMKMKRIFRDLREDYEWVGSVRSLEVTYGRHGWHPHIHELVLLKNSITPGQENGLLKSLREQWLKALAGQGYDASWEHGLDLETRDRNIRTYIIKFGHEPIKRGWGLEDELTKSNVKLGRKDGRTPQQLLADYGGGDMLAGRIYIDYAYAFKGRNQLVWSRGLRDLLGMNAEKTDAETAEETPEDLRVLAELTVIQWRGIVRADLRGDLLHFAVTLPEEEFLIWLRDTLERVIEK